MSNFSKNVMALTASMLAIVGVLSGIAYYVDKNFGDGVSAIVMAVLVGFGLSMLSRTVGTFQDNRTHQSAGDDITGFYDSMAKIDAVRAKTHHELARGDREVRVLAAKEGFETHKDGLRRGSRVWLDAKRQVDREEAERDGQRQAEEQQANESQWYYTGNDADAPVDVELQ